MALLVWNWEDMAVSEARKPVSLCNWCSQDTAYAGLAGHLAASAGQRVLRADSHPKGLRLVNTITPGSNADTYNDLFHVGAGWPA